MGMKYCKHMVIIISREGNVKRHICNAVADQVNSWCREHRAAQTILDKGKLLGYPRVVKNEGQEEEQELIGAGYEQWEEYAIYSLCIIPIMKNHRQVLAPTGLQKITPYLNELIVKNRPSEGQQQASSKPDVTLRVSVSKPAIRDSESDLAGIFGDTWEVESKKPVPAPGKVAVLDREEDIAFDPDEVFDF